MPIARLWTHEMMSNMTAYCELNVISFQQARDCNKNNWTAPDVCQQLMHAALSEGSYGKVSTARMLKPQYCQWQSLSYSFQQGGISLPWAPHRCMQICALLGKTHEACLKCSLCYGLLD